VKVFVDSSALVAILTREEDVEIVAAKLVKFESAMTSPIAIFESALAIARKSNSAIVEAHDDVSDFVNSEKIEIVEISEDTSNLALIAFDRFGKGRHKAALNMGDCFSYACARQHHVPLLFKGDDFIHTDIRIA
jgi:ribonuclease VapC